MYISDEMSDKFVCTLSMVHLRLCDARVLLVLVVPSRMRVGEEARW